MDVVFSDTSLCAPIIRRRNRAFFIRLPAFLFKFRSMPSGCDFFPAFRTADNNPFALDFHNQMRERLPVFQHHEVVMSTILLIDAFRMKSVFLHPYRRRPILIP